MIKEMASKSFMLVFNKDNLEHETQSMKHINFFRAISKVSSLLTSVHPAPRVKCQPQDEAQYHYSDLEIRKARNSCA